MKVVKSVIVLAMRGYNILYSDWGEKILCRSVHHIELTFVYGAQKRTCYFHTVNYRFNYCQYIFVSLIFIALWLYENILTMKFSQIMVPSFH